MNLNNHVLLSSVLFANRPTHLIPMHTLTQWKNCENGIEQNYKKNGRVISESVQIGTRKKVAHVVNISNHWKIILEYKYTVPLT